MVCQGEPAPCGSLQVLRPSVWPAQTSHQTGQIGPQQWDDPPPPELPPLLLHLDQSPPLLFLPASLFPRCSTSPPLDMGQKHKLMRLMGQFWISTPTAIHACVIYVLQSILSVPGLVIICRLSCTVPSVFTPWSKRLWSGWSYKEHNRQTESHVKTETTQHAVKGMSTWNYVFFLQQQKIIWNHTKILISSINVHCYLNVLQADVICIQWDLDTGLQQLLQIANGLINVDILLN